MRCLRCMAGKKEKNGEKKMGIVRSTFIVGADGASVMPCTM